PSYFGQNVPYPFGIHAQPYAPFGMDPMTALYPPPYVQALRQAVAPQLGWGSGFAGGLGTGAFGPGAFNPTIGGQPWQPYFGTGLTPQLSPLFPQQRF